MCAIMLVQAHFRHYEVHRLPISVRFQLIELGNKNYRNAKICTLAARSKCFLLIEYKSTRKFTTETKTDLIIFTIL